MDITPRTYFEGIEVIVWEYCRVIVWADSHVDRVAVLIEDADVFEEVSVFHRMRGGAATHNHVYLTVSAAVSRDMGEFLLGQSSEASDLLEVDRELREPIDRSSAVRTGP